MRGNERRREEGKKKAGVMIKPCALHRLSSLQLRLTALRTTSSELLLRVVEPAHDHFALDSLCVRE